MPARAGEPYSVSVNRTIADADHRPGDPRQDHRREDPRQPRNVEQGPVGGGAGRRAGHDGGRSGLTQRAVEDELEDGRPIGGDRLAKGRLEARRPIRPGRRARRRARAIAVKSIGPRSVRDRRALALGSVAAVLVHPDRPVALVVEDDRDDLGLLANGRLELGHRHREAAVAGDRDDDPIAVHERRGDRGRQRVAHRARTSGRGTSRAGGTGSGGPATGRSCRRRSRRWRRRAGAAGASRSHGRGERPGRPRPPRRRSSRPPRRRDPRRCAARRASTLAASRTAASSRATAARRKARASARTLSVGWRQPGSVRDGLDVDVRPALAGGRDGVAERGDLRQAAADDEHRVGCSRRSRTTRRGCRSRSCRGTAGGRSR